MLNATTAAAHLGAHLVLQEVLGLQRGKGNNRPKRLQWRKNSCGPPGSPGPAGVEGKRNENGFHHKISPGPVGGKEEGDRRTKEWGRQAKRSSEQTRATRSSASKHSGWPTAASSAAGQQGSRARHEAAQSRTTEFNLNSRVSSTRIARLEVVRLVGQRVAGLELVHVQLLRCGRED